jgi:hypothetical protein
VSAAVTQVELPARATPRTAGVRRDLRLSTEVEAQLRKLRELGDQHAVSLLWQAIHETTTLGERGRGVPRAHMTTA